MSDRIQGTVKGTEDDRFAITLTLPLAHPPEAVWKAVTEKEPLSAWFPAVVDFLYVPGGKLRFLPTAEQHRRFGLTEDDATAGEVTEMEWAKAYAFTWDRDDLRWDLAPDGEGGTILTLTHVIRDATAIPPLAAGWHAGLEVLEAQLDGRPVTWSPWDRADELEARYEP